MKKSINVTSDSNRLDVNVHVNEKALLIYLADFISTDEGSETSIFSSAYIYTYSVLIRHTRLR